MCATPDCLSAGQLIILAAGDESLFKECELAFDTMGKKAFFLGACGAGAKMKLVANMVMGSMMGTFLALSMCAHIPMCAYATRYGDSIP